MKSLAYERRAFTLVELLVTIAIIGILLGLLLAAVQNVRAAAARTKCANNLRQLGLAVHHYHDTRGSFPQGCSFLNGADPQPHMSWLTRLLPFVEQEALWRQSVSAFQQQKFFLTPPHFPIVERVIPQFLCPSDPESHEAASVPTFRVAFTNYLGVWGTDHSKRDGVLYLDSRIRILEIRDGASSTLMIGERPPSADHFLGWWYAGWGQSKDGSAEMLLGVREINDHPRYYYCPKGPYHFMRGNRDDNCDVFHFWSYHSGGSNFVFADGSVHFLSYSADSILPALASRMGGETVSIPD